VQIFDCNCEFCVSVSNFVMIMCFLDCQTVPTGKVSIQVLDDLVVIGEASYMYR
jgi:hypothetical protein